MNKYFFIGCLDVIIIIILSLISSGTLKHLVIKDLLALDKLGHFGFYGIASFCYSIHYKINKPIWSYPLIKIFILLFSLGMLLEILQYYSALGRVLDLFDQLANTLGIIAGIIISKFFYRPKKILTQS